MNVYPEKDTDLKNIESLDEPSTYYVVDPGETKNSGNPMAGFMPRVIIISSLDDKHWGRGEFQMHRAKKTGVFRYYPLWTLTEVLRGWDYFPLPSCYLRSSWPSGSGKLAGCHET